MAAADGQVARIRELAARTRALAPAFADRLTPADPDDGDQWDEGQVLAHIAEFLPYWTGQFQAIVTAGGGIDFGRVKTTPARIARIEAGRHEPAAVLLDRMDAAVEVAAAYLESLNEEQLQLVGIHPTRGEMAVSAGVDRFMIDHFEEHVAQMEEGS